MARATFVQPRFTGGEWSKAAQGRIDSPDYRAALNVCLNGIPIESGSWLRRGGTRHCMRTRGGAAGKLIGFDFRARFPYQMLISDGVIRYFAETTPVHDDEKTIVSISSADPAVVTTNPAHNWITGDEAVVHCNVKQLMNRPVIVTVTGATTFSLADSVTGDGIDGADLDAFTSGTIKRIAETDTAYTGDNWRTVRSIQAETSAVLVNGLQTPYVLSVSAEPTDTSFAEFAIEAANFLDGPYLDPIPGSYATASAVSGVVTITLSFQPYDANVAYNDGDYVTSAGQGYRSIAANNQGHAPPNATYWLAVNAGDPINDGAGFTSADVGRLVRLFSEPALWASGTSYASGDIVTYEAAGEASGYYQATGAVSGGGASLPGRSTLWSVRTGASVARWTWGRILSVSASGVTAPDSYVGDMTGGGGITSAFDANPTKGYASAANYSSSTDTRQPWLAFPWPVGSEVQYAGRFYRLDLLASGGASINFAVPPAGYTPYWTDIGTASSISFDHFVGGHLPAPTAISSATVTPATDIGFANTGAIGLNLRAKPTAPLLPSDGTLLGTTGVIANTTSPVSITSGDQSTLWNYVWIEVLANFNQPLPDDGSHSFTAKIAVAQVAFYAPNIANGSAISVQIAGDPLLYSNASRKWRLGLFGGSNLYPTCGTYDDNRIWFGGVLGNRVDSSMSGALRNGVLTLNMAPTAPDGTVTDAHAISAVFTAKDVNQVTWMEPDQQGIICGTQAGEWLVGAAAPGALSPLNIKAARVTKVGCADILPQRTDHTLVFVQKFGQKIQEYFADVVSGKFSSPHITKTSKHLTVPGLAELAYQQELAPVVWGRLANGGLIGITYQRDSNTVAKGPDIAGAHRHQHGETRAVRSISVGASADGTLDSLYMVTEDPAGGEFNVEMMTSLLSEGFTLPSCWFLDNGIVPTLAQIDNTVSDAAPYGGVRLYGLRPHEGKTVAAWVAGLDCGSRGFDEDGEPQIEDFTVEDGSILVPFGDGVNQGCGDGLFTQEFVAPYLGTSPLPIVVGFPFVSDGQIVRPALPTETGTRTGPGLGRVRRTDHILAQLYGCVHGKISLGTDFDHLKPARLLIADGETPLTALQLFDGIVREEPEADSDLDNMICWRIERPHPGFVVAIGGSLKAEDE